METIDRFSEQVGSLYDCIPDPARWQSTLGLISSHFESALATISVLDIERGQARFGAAHGDRQVLEPLITIYAPRMPLYKYIPLMDVDVPMTMESFFDLAGPGTRELFYERMRGWFEPNNLTEAIVLSVFKSEGRIGSFVLNFPGSRRPVDKSDLAAVALLAPHIRRAVTIGDLFEIGQRESDVFKSVIDNFATAVIAVTGQMRLTYANTEAERLLREGLLFTAPSGALQFREPRTQAAIEHAIRLGERSEVAIGTAGLGVPASRAERPAVAHVLPLTRRTASGQFHGHGAAAIFIAAAGMAPVSAIEAIAALFGLTAAEKRVATQIANGLSRAEIALASGTTDGTVKSQLAAIFDKTGTSSQRELELLIRELTPPVRPARTQ